VSAVSAVVILFAEDNRRLVNDLVLSTGDFCVTSTEAGPFASSNVSYAIDLVSKYSS
jgi:hypothetical protein